VRYSPRMGLAALCRWRIHSAVEPCVPLRRHLRGLNITAIKHPAPWRDSAATFLKIPVSEGVGSHQLALPGSKQRRAQRRVVPPTEKPGDQARDRIHGHPDDGPGRSPRPDYNSPPNLREIPLNFISARAPPEMGAYGTYCVLCVAGPQNLVDREFAEWLNAVPRGGWNATCRGARSSTSVEWRR